MWILTAGQGGGLRPCQAMGDGAMGPLGGSSLDSEVTCPHKSHCVLGTNGCDSCMLLRLLTCHRSRGSSRAHAGLPGRLTSAPLISSMVPPQRQMHPELDPADAYGSATGPQFQFPSENSHLHNLLSSGCLHTSDLGPWA